MKILHTIHSVSPSHGGTSSAVQTLATACTRLGHTTLTVCLDDPAASWLPNWGGPIQALGPGLTHYGWNRQYFEGLQKAAIGFDLLVIHGLWQYHASATRQISRKLGIPYIVAPHGMLDPWAMKQSLFKRLSKHLSWQLDTRLVLRDAASIWFTTAGEQTAAAPSLRHIQSRHSVTTLGVEPPPLDLDGLRENWRSRHADLKDREIFLFLGRLHPKKGCDILIQGFADWLRTLPDNSGRKPHLRFVGPASDETYLGTLRALADRCGLVHDRDISFMDMVSGDEKWAELASSSALILPSYQENFGMVVGEALACGVPPLISTRVNLSEAVVRAGAGLAEEPTTAGVTRLLGQWFSRSPSASQQMRANARQLYLDAFQPSAAATSFLEMANSIEPSPN